MSNIDIVKCWKISADNTSFCNYVCHVGKIAVSVYCFKFIDGSNINEFVLLGLE